MPSDAVLVAVLAGGRSRRMGRAKAAVPLAGRPLLAWVLAAAEDAGLEAVVVAKPGSALPSVGVPVWHERAPRPHPLAGLIHALERAAGRPMLAAACDMPFVTPALLHRLATLDAPAATARTGWPFPGRYTAAALPVLRDALEREAPVRAALAALGAVELDAAELRALGDPERMLLGVNTPEDLAAAERLTAAEAG